MRIVHVSNYYLPRIGYQETFLSRAQARLGHEVRGVHTNEPWKRTSWLNRQMQRRLQRGSVVDEINHFVLKDRRRPTLYHFSTLRRGCLFLSTDNSYVCNEL